MKPTIHQIETPEQEARRLINDHIEFGFVTARLAELRFEEALKLHDAQSWYFGAGYAFGVASAAVFDVFGPKGWGAFNSQILKGLKPEAKA